MYPFFPATPSQNWGIVNLSGPSFRKFKIWRFNPPAERGGDAHYKNPVVPSPPPPPLGVGENLRSPKAWQNCPPHFSGGKIPRVYIYIVSIFNQVINYECFWKIVTFLSSWLNHSYNNYSNEYSYNLYSLVYTLDLSKADTFQFPKWHF